MQNIKIKYEVDKTEVDKSTTAVNQAKAATDNLKKSIEQTGNQAKKSNAEHARAIGYVKQEMARLKAQIDVTSRSDTKRLNDLIAQYKAAKKQVDDFNKSLAQQNQQTKQVTQSSQSLTASFMSMYQALKLVIAAGVVREFVSLSLEAAKLSGNVLAVGNAFKSQIPNSEVLLNRLQKATRGTVGDLELMQRALKFQNFGADVQKLPELLEFAAVRAQQTGESVDYLVNSIVNGIGRKSILILDNLGISSLRLKEELGDVSIKAASIGQVTEAVSRIAQEELTKMGGYAETAATKVDKISVSWEKLKKSLADSAASKSLLDFYDTVLQGADLFVRALQSQEKGVQALRNIAFSDQGGKLAFEEFEKLQKRINEEQLDGIQISKEQIEQNNKRIETNKKEIESFREMTKNLSAFNDKDVKRRENAGQAITYYEIQNFKLIKLNELLKEYAENLDKINKKEEEKKNERIGLIPALEEEIAQLEELINGSQNEEGRTVGGAGTRRELAKLNKELEILKAKLNDLRRLGTGMIWDPQNKVWLDIEKIVKNIKELNLELKKGATGLFDYSEVLKRVEESVKNIPPIPIKVKASLDLDGDGTITKGEIIRKQIREAFQEYSEELTMGSIDIVTNIGQSLLDIELMNQEQRLRNLQDFYDEQQNLAGNNDRYKQELRIKEERETKRLQRELAISQRRARLYSIAIDTAASITKAWVNPGFPGAVPLSAFLLAQGAAQAAIVQRTPMGFKDGVIDLKGPGTTTSDSIPANLSRRESVMTARETISSKGILMAIRAKTLDDKKLARIMAMDRSPVDRSSDNSKIEKHLEQISKNTVGSNFVANSSEIFEAKQVGGMVKRYNRSKFLSK